jgi:hypothetical protein
VRVQIIADAHRHCVDGEIFAEAGRSGAPERKDAMAALHVGPEVRCGYAREDDQLGGRRG